MGTVLAVLQYLFAILLTLPGVDSAPATDEALLVGAAILCATSFALLAFGSWTLRRIARVGPGGARGYLRATTPLTILLLGSAYLVAQHGGGALLPERLGVGEWIGLPHLIRLAPFALLHLTLHFVTFAVASRAGLATMGFLQSLSLGVRQGIIPILPPVVLLLLYDLLRVSSVGDPDSTIAVVEQVLTRVPLFQVAFAAVVVLLALLVSPFVLRRIWRAYPLPEGPLRDRLLAYSTDVGLRVNDILVWPTDKAALNAALVGAFPGFRYIVLTDGLLEVLGEDEILAVYAHEAGHARKGHVPLYFGFSLVLVLLTLLPGEWLGPVGDLLAALPPPLRVVALVVIWLGLIFGWISRRFEQEADVFGIETMPATRATEDGGAHPFERALETIATEAGDVREVTGWRHFSIGDRIEFVRAYLADAGVRRHHRRVLTVVRGGVITGVLVVLAVAALQVPAALARADAVWNTLVEPERSMLEQLSAARLVGVPAQRALLFTEAAELARIAGRTEEALRWQREAILLAPTNGPLLTAYARLLEEVGRPAGALLAWRDAVEAGGLPGGTEQYARRRIEALEGALDDR